MLVLPGESDHPEPPVYRVEPDVPLVEADEGVGSIRKGAGPPGIDRRRNEVANLLRAIRVGDVDEAQARGVPGERGDLRLLGVVHAQIVRAVFGALKDAYGARGRNALVVGQRQGAVLVLVDLQAEARYHGR